jgi:putative transposase
MPRAHAILQSDYPYNLSARCINREWFSLPMEQVWEIFCEQLSETHEKYRLEIHTFVLMSNHFHLIASTPRANISECMWHFMRSSSLRLTRSGNRINETFAGRHYKCILQSPNYYLNAYKYNYLNPVSAGICDRAEDYSFSSLPMVMGKSRKSLPLLADTTYDLDPIGTLEWINSIPEPSLLEAARYGFKHSYFRSKKCRNTNRYLLRENDTL